MLQIPMVEGGIQPWFGINEDILLNIFSFFNGKQLKEVRKVCRNWNSLATSSRFRQHFRLNILELGKDPADHVALSSQLQCPQIFFQNIFCWAIPSDSVEIPYLSFLEHIGYSHVIKEVYTTGPQQVLLLGKASMYGLLPNLTKLEAMETTVDAKQSKILLAPHTFPHLKTLILYVKDQHPFWQSIVSACPKLKKLTSTTPFIRTNPNQLRELIIYNYTPKIRTQSYLEMLKKLFEGQGYSLKRLTIMEFPELPEILASKPILNLEEISLNLDCSSDGRNAMDFRNLFRGIPNIKRLKVGSDWACPPRTWGNIAFRTKLENLEKLEFELNYPGEKNENWVRLWQSLLPVGKPQLCVKVHLPLHSSNQDWHTTEDLLEDALNMSVPNLVVCLPSTVSLSKLLRILFHVELKLSEGVETQGTLEFWNKVSSFSETEREKYIRLLPAVCAKFSDKWGRINFKHFRIPENTLGLVKEYFKDAPIAAEIYA